MENRMNLSNLRSLYDDMCKEHWTISGFNFKYKSINYSVLVKRFVAHETRTSKYALVKLVFLSNDGRRLEVEANTNGILVDRIEVLKDFFLANKDYGYIKWIEQFYSKFNQQIITKCPEKYSDELLIELTKSLSISDSEDPRKIYLIGLRRNPADNFRSEFNADKARLLRPNLFEEFRSDNSISFCFSMDKTKQKNDQEIIYAFNCRNQ